MSSRVVWFVIGMTLQTFRWQNFTRLWNRRVLVWAYGPWWDTFFRGLADKARWICWKCLKLCCMFENQLYSACFEGPTFQLTERDLKSSDPSLKVSSRIWWLKDSYLPPTCTQDEKRGHVLNRLAFREITKCVCAAVTNRRPLSLQFAATFHLSYAPSCIRLVIFPSSFPLSVFSLFH